MDNAIAIIKARTIPLLIVAMGAIIIGYLATTKITFVEEDTMYAQIANYVPTLIMSISALWTIQKSVTRL